MFVIMRGMHERCRQARLQRHGEMGGMHYGSGWGFLLMSVSVLAFGVLVVVATVLIVRALVRDNRSEQQVADPRQILAQRFARGEIDETEYRSRLSVLHNPATPPT